MPVRLGRAVRWRAEELRAWVEKGCPPRARWNAEKSRKNALGFMGFRKCHTGMGKEKSRMGRPPLPEDQRRMFQFSVRVTKSELARLRADLEAAGIPVEDDSGRLVDFHALRHTFITNLVNAGVHPRTVQALARHSTISLTMDRYTHLSIAGQTRALEALPDLDAPGMSEAARATGTDAESVLPFCLPSMGAKRGASRHGLAQEETALSSGVKRREVAKTLAKINAHAPETVGAPGRTRTPDRRYAPHRGFAPLALRDAPACRVPPLSPRGGNYPFPHTPLTRSGGRPLERIGGLPKRGIKKSAPGGRAA